MHSARNVWATIEWTRMQNLVSIACCFLNTRPKRLHLMMEKRSEQEVILAEIVDAKLSPNPPSALIDR